MKKIKDEPSLLDAYKSEVKHRWFSSRRKIIKTIGLIFVPFVYAFICIFALWNPLGNINKIPTAIVSFEHTSLVVGDYNAAGNNVPVKFGMAKEYHTSSSTDLKPINWETNYEDIPDGSTIITNVGTEIVKSNKTFWKKISFTNLFMEEWKEGRMQGFTYNKQKDKYGISLSNSISLDNIDYISYHSDTSPEKYARYENNKWTNFNSKYYAQIDIPSVTTSSLINYFDADLDGTINPEQFLKPLKDQRFNFFTTYEKNFVTAEIIDRFSDFGTTLLKGALPSLASFMVNEILNDMLLKNLDDYSYISDGTSLSAGTYKVAVSGETVLRGIAYGAITPVNGTKYVSLNSQITPIPTPSIQGDTQNIPWNKNDDTISFIHALRNLTKTIVDIPGVAEIIADTINETFNSKHISYKGVNLEIFLKDSNIAQIFSSDSLLASFLLQDGRFIRGGNEDFFIDLKVGPYDIPFIPYSLLLSLMCDPNVGLVPGKTLFQDMGILPLMGTGTYAQDDEFFYMANNDPIFLYKSETEGVKSFYGNLNQDLIALRDAIGSSTSIDSLSDFVTKNVIGTQYSQYGIGVGQLFICVGLWVGAFTQIMVYDRKKKVKKLRTHKWFFSKTMLMYSTCVFQVLLLGLALGALGWFALGGAYALEWIFMLFMSLIFVIIIQSIWFSFRDRAIAFFIIVVYLVINIGMGLGTFPSFMQFPIVQFLSYLTPFHYMIQIQGAIIYGVTGNVAGTTLYVFENIGILLIFAGLFLTLGLWQAHKREREIFYGTCSNKKLSIVLKQMDLSQYLDEKSRVVWKTLPKEHMDSVAKKVQEQFPYEQPFPWFKKQEDVPTDKDIVEIE